MWFVNWFLILIGVHPPDGRLRPEAGGGEVIPNGSMHWREHQNGLSLERSNDFDTAKIGMDPGRPHLVPGHLHVRLRFASREQALEALAKAPILAEGEQAFCLALDVPAISRHTSTENLPADVRVEW